MGAIHVRGCPVMPHTILDDIKRTVAEYYDSERTISFYRDFWGI